ncbi:MAG: hypothetical protein WKF36_09415 [Candidatus Nitrosocosmicus sp.]
MNTKFVYTAGIVILIIGIVFYFVNAVVPTSEEEPSPSNSSITSTPTISPAILNGAEPEAAVGSVMPVSISPSSNTAGSNYENLTVSAKSVDILPINDILSARIALDVHNPNKGAAILETLSYSVFFDNVRLVSADIGAKPEGFVDNLGSVYTIIGNQTITLKDRQPITEDGVSLFNSNGTVLNRNSANDISATQTTPDSFVINGTFATTLNRGSQSQASEHAFNSQFPLQQ